MQQAIVIDSPVAIPEDTAVPRRLTYRQIADDLADRIRSGEYQPGQQLPTYKEAADLYDVSEATAYRAMSLLIDRGLAVGEQGRGTFVREDSSEQP